MYIDKYWGNYIGGSDDSLNLVEFLADQNKEEISLSEIFIKIGLDKQNWDFRQTIEYCAPPSGMPPLDRNSRSFRSGRQKPQAPAIL